ncbi:MAG: OmpA family protein [Deltaproteobacteria bacterium]|nr:OmpA family protein [Deltaproteobacteria bacterium]
MRRRKPEEHVNNERWLVSYADFITLLFAFFTSLYAISTVDARKAGKMVFSTRAAFNLEFFRQDKPVLGYPTSGPTSIKDLTLPDKKVVPGLPQGNTTAGAAEANSKQVKKLARQLQRYADVKGLQDKVSVRVLREHIIVSLAAAAFFNPGEAEIRAESLPTLNLLAEELMSAGCALRVEGHTDDQPSRVGKFRNNWELSTARAVRVVRYLLEEFAFPATELSAAGYASFHPVASNATVAGRAANRRVDFVLEAPKPRPAGD